METPASDPRLAKEWRHQVQEYREQGFGLMEACERTGETYGVSMWTVYNWVDEARQQDRQAREQRRRGERARLRQIASDAEALVGMLFQDTAELHASELATRLSGLRYEPNATAVIDRLAGNLGLEPLPDGYYRHVRTPSD